MNYEQKELIHAYLNLDKQIHRQEKRREFFEMEFRHQNYSGSTRFCSNEGVSFQGFKVDLKVSNHIDRMNAIESKISRLKRKKHYFNRFLMTMESSNLKSIKRRYDVNYNVIDDIQTLGSDRKVLDEILEIEEAISHEFNTELPRELNKKFVSIAEAELTEETIESSFEAMLEALGV